MQTFSRVVRLKGVSRYEGNGRKDDCGGETTAGRALHRGDSSKPRGHVSRGADDAPLGQRRGRSRGGRDGLCLRAHPHAAQLGSRSAMADAHHGQHVPQGAQAAQARAAQRRRGRPIAPREAENIWALVERLDALYSVPLVMAYAEGMKLEEIAAALHVPKGTVSARMTRGRQKLKTWMEEER